MQANYDLIFIKCIITRLDAFTAPDTAGNATTKTEAMGDLRSSLSDLSAHIVTKEVRKDQPVLRVLFHAGPGHSKRNKVCILVSVVLNNNTVEGKYIIIVVKLQKCCSCCAIFNIVVTMSINLRFINLITF